LSVTEWIVIFAIIALIGLYVVPLIIQNRALAQAESAAKSRAREAAACRKTNVLKKTVTEAAPDTLGYPEPAGKGVKNLTPDDAMVATYYKDGNECVPMQYPKLSIGACPYSKPMSTDLPLANVPMCMATRNENMKLR
jgi:type II secretory pathway pseudopilin PulG